MATGKLHTSTYFFKQLSLELQQLKLTIQLLETFVFRAKDRGQELKDNRLLLILDQLDGFVLNAKCLNDRLLQNIMLVGITD